MVLAWLFEQRNEPVDFACCVFVGLFGSRRVVNHGVDQDRYRLRDPVKDQQLVGDEEAHDRRLQVVAGWARHDRLNIVDEFVADEPDCPARETRQLG